MLRLYFAPLEGVTDVNFRRIHAQIFPESRADRYYAPFFSPTVDTPMTERDIRALSPENNRGLCVIPQIMANRPEPFLIAARELAAMGYDEVNLNLGCPSGTVVSKGRGAGFLSDPDALDRFLDAVFSDGLFAPPTVSAQMRLSVKSRLGMFSPDEYPDILDIYNRYPISELILHPRVRKEMYKGDVHTDQTVYTQTHSALPLCVNGDIFTCGDAAALLSALPQKPHALMLGRGAVANPMLFAQIRALETGSTIPALTKDHIAAFFTALTEDALCRLSGERHVLFRLKELFAYWIVLFDDADTYRKRLRKANTLAEFHAAAEGLFSDCALSEDPGFLGNAKMNG